MNDNERGGMEIAFAIILLIFACLLIALAIVTLVGKWQANSAAAYEKRITAEREYDTAIIRAAKVLVVGNIAYVTKGVDKNNQIIYAQHVIDQNGSPITADIINGERITLHQIASQLVDDSITSNGIDGVKLLTADQWEAMGNPHELHRDALAYLMPLGLTKVQGGRPDGQGVFVKKGETLQTLLRDLAIYAIPLAMGQRIDKS